MSDEEKEVSLTEVINSIVKQSVNEALQEYDQKHKNAGITKESIMAIQNRAERQKMIEQHMDLFTGKKG